MGAASLRQSLAKLVLRVFHHLSDNCVDRTGRGIFDFVNTIKTNIQGIKNQLWYQIVRMLADLLLLLLPLAECAPPMHNHAPPPPCDTTTCRVSDQSLNSALSTFLCFTKEETSAMEELVAMDSQAMVSLVNLVLHEGSGNAVKKTRKLHLEDLVKSVARASNLNMKPKFYKNVDPILLALLNCQSKTIAEIHELVEPMAGADRAGRGIFDFVNTIKTKITSKISQNIGNKETMLRTKLNDKADDKDIEHPPNKVMILNGKMQDKLEVLDDKMDVLNNKMEMAGRDKALILKTKADLIQNLESITALVNLMQQKKKTVAPIFRKTTAAPTK